MDQPGRRIRIAGGTVYTGAELISPATLEIEGDRIASLTAERPDGSGPAPGPDSEIDARGLLVTPGLINAHTHCYSTLARGISCKDPAPRSFVQILERLWWRLDLALTLEDVELSAFLHGLECLRHGVTTVFDHHASQGAVLGSLAAVSKALRGLGLRSCLCYEVSDRSGPEAIGQGIEENAAHLASIAARSASGETMERACFGLHASFTLSDATLEACARAEARNPAGFHIHVAEDRADEDDSLRRHGTRVLHRLQRFGLLGERTLCVHGIHLDDRELEILAASRSWLVHCPESNMNNAVGGLRLARLRGAGVRAALGTDGFTADLPREALAAHLLQNHLSGNPQEGWETASGLLFGANAALAREIFGCDLGRLAPGAPADVVVWDYRPPTPLSIGNLWGHVLFGLVGARARDVLVAGEPVLRAGRSVHCREEELLERCSRAARRLWERS